MDTARQWLLALLGAIAQWLGSLLTPVVQWLAAPVGTVSAWLLWALQLHVGSASSLEIVWTVASFGALAIVLYLWHKSRQNRQALARQPAYLLDGPLDIIAVEDIRNNGYKIAMEVFLSFVGIVALISPTPYKTPTPYAIILSLGSTSIAIMLAVAAVQDYQGRREFLRQVRRLNALRNRRVDDATALPEDVPNQRVTDSAPIGQITTQREEG